MSQAIYSVIDPVTGERVFLTGTRLYGYKIGIDTAAVREFFKFGFRRNDSIREIFSVC